VLSNVGQCSLIQNLIMSKNSPSAKFTMYIQLCSVLFSRGPTANWVSRETPIFKVKEGEMALPRDGERTTWEAIETTRVVKKKRFLAVAVVDEKQRRPL